MQTRKVSLLEGICNQISGFVIALLVWELVIEPVFGIEKNFAENVGITTVFALVSLARGYVLRRIFNRGEG